MKWETDFSKAPEMVKVSISGQYCLERFKLMVDEIIGHPHWSTGMDALFDYRDCAFKDIHYEELCRARSVHKAKDDLIGKCRSALLMPSEAGYGLGRMYESLVDEHIQARVRTFLEEEEAVAWLKSHRKE